MKKRLLSTLTWCALLVIYGGFLAAYVVACGCGLLLTRRGRRVHAATDANRDLMVIGTFYTRNWCIAHLAPLARAKPVRSVIAIVDGPTEPIEHVRFVEPPPLLLRVVGRAFAKLYCATREALICRPAIVMGFHLLPGAMTALLVARLVGAKAGYQLTAGPIELEGGGAATENFFLKRLGRNSRVLELLTCRIGRCFDLMVVRGRKGRRFLLDRAMGGLIRIIPGSLNTARLAPDGEKREFDVISVCRLVAIKQPDHILKVLQRLAQHLPDFRAIILGDGPLREALEREASHLGIAHQVEFRGHVEDVERYLKRSKVFLLTSRSEGLSIAMAEAMAAGVVPVVADVGELADLVRNGETGYVIQPGAFDSYAERIGEILNDPSQLESLSEAAREMASTHNSVEAVVARWDRALTDLLASDGDNSSAPARRGLPLFNVATRRRLWNQTPDTVRRLLGPISRQWPPSTWLGARFRKEMRFLEQAQWWDVQRCRDYQFQRLRSLCRLAYERTDYYHELFTEMGFHPSDLRSLEDWKQLPTLTPQILRDHEERMSTLPPGAGGAEYVSTGGSSGHPLRFRIGDERSSVEYAYLMQSWTRSGFTPDTMQAVLRGEIVPDRGDGLRYKYDPLLRRYYYSTFHMTDENMARYLSHMATIGPCYLHVYPSSVAILARYIRRTGETVPSNIRGILAGSERLYPQDRELIEQVLGTRCFSWYGQTEKVVMASECEHSTDYHVWPTYGYFELLDEDGQPVTTPGQSGEIVGTGFINTVVPFIRYRTGDTATYVSDRCDKCGRPHPIIRDICGHRMLETLVASDGSLIPWTAVNMHDRTFDNVVQFQFRQTEPGRAILCIVPAPAFDETDRARILDSLSGKLNGRIELTLETTGKLPLTERGKSVYVDQRIDLDRLAAVGSGAK